VVLRVRFPMSFYAKGLKGHIDKPDAGWKDRGVSTPGGRYQSARLLRAEWLLNPAKNAGNKAAQISYESLVASLAEQLGELQLVIAETCRALPVVSSTPMSISAHAVAVIGMDDHAPPDGWSVRRASRSTAQVMTPSRLE
jgi:hypothetical protein